MMRKSRCVGAALRVATASLRRIGSAGLVRLAALLLLLPAALMAGVAAAQTVSMSGSLGSKALLMIDGKPHSMAVGSTVDGVTLLSVSGSDAVVALKGAHVHVVLGGAQIDAGGAPSEGGASQIVLTADLGGHFYAAGSINGKAVRFVVDTGATMVSMSQDDAQRLGLDYKSGRRLYSNTANGRVPVYGVSLGSVRVGDVQVYNVDAVVMPASSMGHILLGNSFLTRFQMKRENDRMTLDRRF